MRLALQLEPQSDIVWMPKNQYKLRGLLYNALNGTKYEYLHNDTTTPSFCFSNIYPKTGYTNLHESIEEGTQSMLLIDSPHPGVLDVINSYFKANRNVEIGDNKLKATGLEYREPDVGAIGTKGTIKTQTGIYIKLDPEDQKRFNLEVNPDYRVSWTPDMGVRPFKQKLFENCQWKLESLLTSANQYPESFNDLFDSHEVNTVFETDINVSEDQIWKIFPSVVEFNYTVTSPEQRQWLNTLLETGLGNQNALGFGFSNVIDTSNL